MDNKKIILNTLVKGAISGVLAGVLDYHLGRYGVQVAFHYGLGVFIATTSTGYIEMELEKTPQPKALSFLEARAIESLSSIGLAYYLEPSTWKNQSPTIVYGVSIPAKYNNLIPRISTIILSDFIAGLVVKSITN